VRIDVVCPYDLGRPGGVQGQALGLALAYARRGCTVRLLAPGGPGPGQSPPGRPAQGAAPGQLAVIELGRAVGIRANGSVAPLAPQPSVLRRAYRVVCALPPDVLHLHEPLAPGPTWAALLARRRLPRTRAVGTFHRAGGEPYRFVAPLARWALASLDQAVAVSPAAEATARPVLGERPCPVLGNGVDLGRLERAEPAPSPARPTVLFVGRHEPRKGLEVLLEAAELLGPSWPGTLWVVGEGPRTPELRRRYPPGPRRHWWGRVDDATLAGLLLGSQVVAVPALGGESFGVVVLEALAARSLPLCSDLPAFRAVAGPHARYVPPGDPRAWAAALRELTEAARTGRPPLDPASREAGAAWAARFSFETLAEAYLERFEALRGDSRGASGGPGAAPRRA